MNQVVLQLHNSEFLWVFEIKTPKFCELSSPVTKHPFAKGRWKKYLIQSHVSYLNKNQVDSGILFLWNT